MTGRSFNLPSTANDVAWTYSYNPARQVTSVTRNNDSYAWTAHYAVTRSYTANGLNRYSATGAITPTYDGRGNLASAGATTYSFPQ